MLNGRNLRMENWLWFAGGEDDEINFLEMQKILQEKVFCMKDL